MKLSTSFLNPKHARPGSILLVMAMVLLSSCTWDKVEQPKVVCFDGEVLPLFVTYCSANGCHNGNDRVEGYDLTSYNGIMRGIDAGRPANSKLFEAMTGAGDDAMPPSGNPQPSSTQIELIEQWILEGAVNTTNCAVVGCDTSAVTYSGDIQPMVQTYCVGCHSGGNPSGGINLSNFNTVKQNAQSGRIQGTISGNPAFPSMPPNSAPLSSCYVDKINKWVADGAPNN
jgi:hypothetical protein